MEYTLKVIKELFFKTIEFEGENNLQYSCITCYLAFKTASLSNLKKHMKRKHPELLEKKKSITNISEKTILHDLLTNNKPPCENVVYLFANTNLSLNLLNNEIFKSFLTTENPNIIIPTKYQLNNLLHEKEIEYETSINKKISTSNFISFSLDGWCYQNYNILGVTVRYFDVKNLK